MRPPGSGFVQKGEMKTQPESETIREAVRRHYAAAATQSNEGTSTSCCSPEPVESSCGCRADRQAKTLGYTEGDLASVPEGANLGLGCGNPVAIASLQAGQTVLDLGSGAGFDAFLAARAVGPTGRVIGVDMTPEMLAKARTNARTGGYSQGWSFVWVRLRRCPWRTEPST